MKAWSEARDRVTKLKANDPKKAETQNTDITDRYQKEYFALQVCLQTSILSLFTFYMRSCSIGLSHRGILHYILESIIICLDISACI